MQNLDHLLQNYFGTLSHEELSVIQPYFREEKLAKNDFFIRSGKICNRLSIVKKGILRVYAVSEDGKEVTQWLAQENFLLTEVSGFFFDQPSRWNIQALTETELLTITKEDYIKLCHDFPRWSEIEKRFIMKCFSMMEDRIFTHLSLTTEQRYNLYFDQNKSLFTQVPLQFIASVLGMSPETFSRIRKHQVSNS